MIFTRTVKRSEVIDQKDTDKKSYKNTDTKIDKHTEERLANRKMKKESSRHNTNLLR